MCQTGLETSIFALIGYHNLIKFTIVHSFWKSVTCWIACLWLDWNVQAGLSHESQKFINYTKKIFCETEIKNAIGKIIYFNDKSEKFTIQMNHYQFFTLFQLDSRFNWGYLSSFLHQHGSTLTIVRLSGATKSWVQTSGFQIYLSDQTSAKFRTKC